MKARITLKAGHMDMYIDGYVDTEHFPHGCTQITQDTSGQPMLHMECLKGVNSPPPTRSRDEAITSTAIVSTVIISTVIVD